MWHHVTSVQKKVLRSKSLNTFGYMVSPTIQQQDTNGVKIIWGRLHSLVDEALLVWYAQTIFLHRLSLHVESEVCSELFSEALQHRIWTRGRQMNNGSEHRQTELQ